MKPRMAMPLMSARDGRPSAAISGPPTPANCERRIASLKERAPDRRRVRSPEASAATRKTRPLTSRPLPRAKSRRGKARRDRRRRSSPRAAPQGRRRLQRRCRQGPQLRALQRLQADDRQIDAAFLNRLWALQQDAAPVILRRREASRAKARRAPASRRCLPALRPRAARRRRRRRLARHRTRRWLKRSWPP